MRKYEAEKLMRDIPEFMQLASAKHSLEVGIFSVSSAHVAMNAALNAKNAKNELIKKGYEAKTLVEFWRVI